MNSKRKTRLNPNVIVIGDLVAVVETNLDGSKRAWIGEVIWVHDTMIGVNGPDGKKGVLRGQAALLI